MSCPREKIKSIEASAPGKFILSGEYSVVYNKHAIAASVNLLTKVTVNESKDNSIKLILNNLDDFVVEWPTIIFEDCRLVSANQMFEYSPEMSDQLAKTSWLDQLEKSPKYKSMDESCKKMIRDSCVGFLLLYLSIDDVYNASKRGPIQVSVTSQIPIGAGLGSSSAYSESICGALMSFHGTQIEPSAISKWAYECDRHFHGKPSGVDNSIITYGGCILFRSGKILEQLDVSQSKLHKQKVMLIDTRVPRSTKVLGAKVSNTINQNRAKTDELFDKIDAITMKIWHKLNNNPQDSNDIHCIDDELIDNQRLLEELGVGHERLTLICQLAEKHGYAAKLTGAGGGGNAFFLYHSDDENSKEFVSLETSLRANDFKYHKLDIGCAGVQIL